MAHTQITEQPPDVIVEQGPHGPRLRVVMTTTNLTGSAARNLARTLDRMAEEIDPTPYAEAYRNTAMKQTHEGELEVDDNARISDGADDGAYVEAWIWVSMEDAGIAEYCDECDQLIPTQPAEGALENKHHAESCSLYHAEKD